MPTCSVCGKDFPRNQLELKRDDAGKWVVRCRLCRTEGAAADSDDASAVDRADSESKAGGSDSKLAKIDGTMPKAALDQLVGAKPPVVEPVPERKNDTRTVKDRIKKKELDDFERMKDALRTLAERHSQKPDATEEELFQRRAHERISACLMIEFSHARDVREFSGVVRDISQGGIRFASPKPLTPGEILRAVVHSEGEAGGPDKIETYLEVRRILSSTLNETEVGARFVSRSSVDDKNRRKHPRHEFSGPVFYSRRGCILIYKGSAMDISQGGLRMTVRDSLEMGEELSMRIRTEPPGFANADLVGFMTVARMQRLGTRSYDVGCTFQKVRVIPISRKAGAAGPAGGEPPPP